MEEGNNRLELQRNLGKLSTARPSGTLKSSLSGRSTPRGSPSFRRLNSSRTPRRDGRSTAFTTHWFRSNRIVLWLLLITLWAYAGFYVQSRWAHGDNKEGIFGYGSNPEDQSPESENVPRRDLIASNDSSSVTVGTNVTQNHLKNTTVVLAAKGLTLPPSPPLKKKSKRSGRHKGHGKQKPTAAANIHSDIEVQEEQIPNTNSSYGLLVGPFGSVEDRVLEWSPEKRSGTCDRKGQFARLVWSRKFVLIFHELSMTGAPISMMELGTELLSCGATVSAVVLNKRGGLMPELTRRGIKVLEDKEKGSFKTAMKADRVIAGSAVCASWIEQYVDHSVAGQRNLVWWIMENRREYFDRAKLALNLVKMLIFLSESQSKQWQAWCKEENIQLKPQTSLVPLSVNDELAFVAGIACSLNTPASSTAKMLEKRQLLRKSVREEMGLTDADMLVMSLSSINPGKGHSLLLQSVRLTIDREASPLKDLGIEDSAGKDEDFHSRALLQKRNLLGGEKQEPSLKVLIGSVGSKSNKVPYVKELLSFISQHSNLSNSVLWTPATTRVASLYAAADVYVINSQVLPYSFVSPDESRPPYVKFLASPLLELDDQKTFSHMGIGETFGRVTIEAMAFGLPVLGTDAGGTKEIVEHNVTGLLHPTGRLGTPVLSKNLRFLLENPLARQEMGMRGREKVKKMFLKKHMYKIFGEALYNSMRIK